MRSAVVGALVALGIGGIIASSYALAAAAQPSTAPAAKLPSYGTAPPAAASREMPTAAATAGNTAPQFKGEATGSRLVPALAGNLGLVDTKAGRLSVEKARSQ